MKKWICNTCGYVYEGNNFLLEDEDYVCPLCDANRDSFSIRDVEQEIELATNELTNV